MWQSRTKHDLIIEVWEKLDCESVGAQEIGAILEAVRARFGDAAADSPMRIARLLADEGAALRHAEIMEFWVSSHGERSHGPEFRNLVNTNDLDAAARSIRNIENLRRKFVAHSDREGLRALREEVLDAKADLIKRAANHHPDMVKRAEFIEIAEWLTIWLQSPEIFENWIALRRNSSEFKKRFNIK
jgi:hypothetical protein